MHGKEKKDQQITALLMNEIVCQFSHDDGVGCFTVSETHWKGLVEDWGLLRAYYFALAESLPSNSVKKGRSFWVHKGNRGLLYRTTEKCGFSPGTENELSAPVCAEDCHIILELMLKHVRAISSHSCDLLVKMLLLRVTNKGEENLLRKKIGVWKDSKRE
jgi:hypothetical protein